MSQKKTIISQWAQLLALSSVHFTADAFCGLMHAILPGIQSHFALSVATGGALLTIFLLTCNGVQLLTGHLRADKTTPVFTYTGMVLCVALCFLNFLPAGSAPFAAILLISIISGVGIGITHPEGLRGIHTLDKIRPATSTAVFMAAGILGFSLGGWGSAELFQNYGMGGLYAFGILAVVPIVSVALLNVHIATEQESADHQNNQRITDAPPFWPIMAMSVLAGISSSVTCWIIPQRLNELGFELAFGGISVMLFSLAGGLGSFVWAGLTHKRSELTCTNIALFLGIPFLIAYVFFVENKFAVWLLFVASFCSFGAYPLMVTIARNCKGPNLGRRMALVVGGTWMISSVFPMLFGPVAEHYGAQIILFLSPVGYIFSGIVGLYIQLRMRANSILLSAEGLG